MALEKITNITGNAVYVGGSDIDTDQIIPARFMKCVTFDGLGEYLFYDARFHQDGKVKRHTLNYKKYSQANILISNKNFGCGSSREHAPQAIMHYGFTAIIAESYAEIFFGNCTTLGVPCITMTAGQINKISAVIQKYSEAKLYIDLPSKTLTLKNSFYKFDIKDTAYKALTSGKWDPIAELLENQPAIEAKEKELATVN